MRTIRHGIALTLAGVLALQGRAHAGPVVIRDDLLKDLAITPALGRGYSVATNTFQSICLTGIVKTKPSFNFYYKFTQVEAGTGGTMSGQMGSAIGSGPAAPAAPAAPGAPGADGSIVINGEKLYEHAMTAVVTVDIYYASVDEAQSKLAAEAITLLQANDIPGFFDGCGAYYIRSINRRGQFFSRFEYKTKEKGPDYGFEEQLKTQVQGFGVGAAGSISGAPQGTPNLAGGLPGIASSALGAAAPVAAAAALGAAGGGTQGALAGAAGAALPQVAAAAAKPATPAPGTPGAPAAPGATPAGGLVPGQAVGATGGAFGLPAGVGGTAGTTFAATVAAGQIAAQASASFAQAASSKQLTIESTAEGLGKADGLDLIAYDVATFKTAISNAFKSMMVDDAGMVTSMEVVPWVENIQFQANIKLAEPEPGSPGGPPLPAPTPPPAPAAAPGTPGAPALPGGGAAAMLANMNQPKPMSPYAKKRILNLNGEFLAEVDRSARSRLIAYYRAKLCREELEINWLLPPRPGKEPKPIYFPDGKSIVPKFSLNFKTGAKIPIADLVKAVADAELEKLFDEYQKFLFGSPGSVECMRALLAQDIKRVRYIEISQCKTLEKILPHTGSALIAEHCMPKLVP